MQINCIAIDDEPLALEIITEYASKVPYLNLKACFSNSLSALQFLKNETVDLLLLDIQMPDLTGVQLAQLLPSSTKIIFITAYENFAVKSYDLQAVDYILKPFEFERFLQACERAYKQQMPRVIDTPLLPSDTQKESKFFFVKSEYKMQKVFEDNIMYLEGMKNYIKIVTSTANILTLQSFKKTEELLSQSKFMRVHKSFIVALDKVDFIERNRIYINGNQIPIGDTYRDSFYRKIESLQL